MPRTRMPLVRHCRFTAIDFESAGVSRGKTDSPVQVGLASWSAENGHDAAFVSYLHTDQPIQWAARKVHGIGPEDLADAPSLLLLWPEFKSRLAGVVVGIEHDGKEQHWTFTGWRLVDLSKLRVRLKAEFQASNNDLYR